MVHSGQCGQDFVQHFRADAVSQVVTTGVKHAPLLVSRVRRNSPGHGFAAPVSVRPIFSVLLQLRPQAKRELFLGERCVHRGSYPSRTISIVDHLDRPRANLLSPFDCLIFIVSRAALHEIADDHGVPRIDNLACERGIEDGTVWHLGQALLPALERPHEVASMYAGHILLAVNTYFARVFGGMQMRPRPKRGALASWQLRRAQEAMMTNLGGNITLSEVANECGLSLSYFMRAFKRSTGDAPHRWLLRQRVQHAKTLLRETQMGLAEIAIVCGFADQSHFTRVFGAHTGQAPGVWRRNS
jgi:AraC family transcriptional regulator